MHHASLNLQLCCCLDSGCCLLRIHTISSSFCLPIISFHREERLSRTHPDRSRARFRFTLAFDPSPIRGRATAKETRHCDSSVAKVLAGPHRSRFRSRAHLPTSSCWTWARFRSPFVCGPGLVSCFCVGTATDWALSLRSRVLAEPHRRQVRGFFQAYNRSQGCSEIFTISQSPGGRVPASVSLVLGSQLR